MKLDSELLLQYIKTGSQEAFTELVRRHINLVYSAALRQVAGDAHLAQDVAQNVFTDLARHAASLCRRESLTGWLYTSTHFAASKIVRTENRRRQREEQFMREPTREISSDADWQQLQPILDSAMLGLKDDDREAVLLRYFENQPYAEVGAKLGVNENTARMRVERALEKLRASLARHGITTGTALASVISANAVQTAPATLAMAVTSASLTSVSTGGPALFKTISAMKVKLAAGALAIAGGAIVLLANRSLHARAQIQSTAPAQQLTQANPANEKSSGQLSAADGSQLPANRNQPIKPNVQTSPLNIGENSPATTTQQTNALDTNKIVVSLKLRIVIMPEENLQALRPAWPSPPSGCGTLTADQFKFVMNAIRNTRSFSAADKRIVSVSEAQIENVSGREGAIYSMTPVPIGDTNTSIYTHFDVTPYFSPESSSFRLDCSLILSTAEDVLQPDARLLLKTNETTLLVSQTAVLQTEIPAGFLPSTAADNGPKVLLAFATPTVIGTNQDQHNVTVLPSDATIEAAKARMTNAKQGVVALLMFAADNQDQIPPTLADASRYLKDDWTQRIETNFDLLYSGALSNVANPAQTILLKEKQPQEIDGAWNKTYGFADGHAEIHREANGDFEKFENEHSVPPPAEQ